MAQHRELREVRDGVGDWVRLDYDGTELGRLAWVTRDARQVRRLLALAAIYEGGTRGEAARIGGVGLQAVRDWIIRGARFPTRPQRGVPAQDEQDPDQSDQRGYAERVLSD